MTIKQNPNKELAREIRRKLKENDGYCPCSLIKNEDTKCMCKEFKQQLERNEIGSCHCGLWVAEL